MASNRRELLALSGAILASAAGCLTSPQNDQTSGIAGFNSDEGPDASSSRVNPDIESADLETLIQGNTRFALDLFNELATDQSASDHFLSPFSISMALAMTWAGARGETEAVMADALSFNLDQDTLHPAFNALERQLNERSQDQDSDEDGDPLELNIANALWPREGLDLHEEYVDTLEAHYGVRPVELDYTAPADASETINSWVADETEDRIDDLVSPDALSGNLSLVLTNAIYFLAGWDNEFDEAKTSDAEFTALDGTTDDVSMMSQTETFPYAAIDGHQLVELPYVERKTSMIVILPAEGEFEAFQSSLDYDRLTGLLEELDETHGMIELPRFKLETSYQLSKHLEALGMERAFGGEADFSGMMDGGGAFIDTILHDAFVAVDEEGTEAAAATAVGMGNSGPPPTEFEMIVDRPFLFLIRDRPTDAVLFLGRVVDTPDDPN